MACARVDPSAEQSALSLRPPSAWAWIGYNTLRYFILAKVLLFMVFTALRRLFRAIAHEERALRVRFGRH